MFSIIGPGSVIGVFSPSWNVIHEAPEAAARAEAFIRSQGLRVKRGSLWGKADAYRTGTPRERAGEFNALLRDPTVDILMASVGGQVTNGALPYIDYDFFAENPKPVVGMSDVTVLLLALYAKTNKPVYYGPNFVTSFARLSPYREIAFNSLCDVLCFEDSYEYAFPATYSDALIKWWEPMEAEELQLPNKLITVNGGKARGRLIGGNLHALAYLWGTPYMPSVRPGDILFFEDTEVWAGDLEEDLAKLMLCGAFDEIGGLIIGKCRKYRDGGTGKSFPAFIHDYIGKTDIPILAECDFSHCAPMLTIPIGLTAELDADAQTLRLLRA